ncbi:hypothetical protein E2562_005308 [Oryza meyeriana var. granulata]|uniref:Thioredoxin domain-containing protein n=1 Tax=Oryza meyeriana var. granulata TaxID=110450 RepID=A0A6G1DET8_9ORYZ|nr:hypothetical protein E2562_005308 [Oryza meyeriana var. granulata]
MLGKVTVRNVRGEAIDKELNLRRRGVSYSILFYAAWCPFSSKFRPIFEALSTMFPQIYHFAVEESSAMPRYGVHGFPAILLVNETTMALIQLHILMSIIKTVLEKSTSTILEEGKRGETHGKN